MNFYNGARWFLLGVVIDSGVVRSCRRVYASNKYPNRTGLAIGRAIVGANWRGV